MGLYDQYQWLGFDCLADCLRKFREGNLIWRGGGHQGSRGEPTAQAGAKRSKAKGHRNFRPWIAHRIDTTGG